MASDHELSKEDLLAVVDAVRGMTHANATADAREMLLLALQVAKRTTESDGAVVYRLDESGTLLHRVAAIPYLETNEDAFARMRVDRTWTGGALAKLRAVATPVKDLPSPAQERLRSVGFVHVATVPLHIRGKVIGTLNFSRWTDKPYTQRELHIGEILADLLVVHLENARLLASTSARLLEMRLILDVARTITTSPSLDERLEASVGALAQVIGTSDALLFLLDDDGSNLHGVASARADLRDFVRTMRLSVDSPDAPAEALRTRRTVAITEVEATQLETELGRRLTPKSILALPLLARGEPIGAVLVVETRHIRAWESAEIERAELITMQVATAVANAQLYEKVKQSYEQLAVAQEELVKREKLAALGQLSATLAHEVRNPLGVLFNSLGTLAKHVPSSGDVAILLNIMGEEARRLDRLVRELLEFARPAPPSMQRQILAEVVHGALRAAEQDLGAGYVRLEAELADNLPALTFDHAMLRRALVNLLINAAQAAGRGGAVLVRATAEKGSVVQIDVSDTGPGIPREITERVFDPFFTTKATGTGLGLAIVKSIIESHKGSIELASGTNGHGTVVRIRLPIR